MSYVETDERAWRLAHKAQLELAQVSARYDHDYDLIAEHSSLEFESRWVVERGTHHGKSDEGDDLAAR